MADYQDFINFFHTPISHYWVPYICFRYHFSLFYIQSCGPFLFSLGSCILFPTTPIFRMCSRSWEGKNTCGCVCLCAIFLFVCFIKNLNLHELSDFMSQSFQDFHKETLSFPVSLSFLNSKIFRVIWSPATVHCSPCRVGKYLDFITLYVSHVLALCMI